jgi:SAM-dependent methyltransferase
VNRNAETNTINWSEVNHWRLQFRKKLPSIHKLPVQPSIEHWIIDRIADSNDRVTVLDLGAGSRGLYNKLAPVHDRIEYRSQDVDRSTFQDYYDTAEITGQFDIVTSSEVIEHLAAAEKIGFIDEMYRLTKPGGWLALATPNANHPTIFWRDFTHVMPMHYLDLAGLVARAGYGDVGIYRLTKMNLRKRIAAWYYRPLLKLLHCDFAQSILAVGRKPE